MAGHRRHRGLCKIGCVASRRDGGRRYIEVASLDGYLASMTQVSPAIKAAEVALREAVLSEWAQGKKDVERAAGGAL